jgi:hypothetical protein
MKIYCNTDNTASGVNSELLYWIDKPFWINTHTPGNTRSSWMKLHRNENGRIIIDAIPDQFITKYPDPLGSDPGATINILNADKPSDGMLQYFAQDVHNWWLSRYVPVQPLELLSDDELNEFLEKNDAIYEEVRQAAGI